MAIDDNTSYELTGYQVKDLAGRIRQKADSASLAPVATSGLYSDITGAPTVPTVYNGKLTITQNGKTLGEFTANQSTNTTIDLENSSYSTSETKTNATWIDGKVICKKTVFIASFPNTAEKAVAHGITNLKQVIKLSGFMAISNGGAWPIPMPPNPLSSIETGITAFADQTNIVIRTGSDRSPYSGYITLWYTKTID